MVGCAAQVFGKGAKFSLFKPAEEMVYIGLDEESRTKGKAAIDVVGAQTGKSIGSVLQQASRTNSAISTGSTSGAACLNISHGHLHRCWVPEAPCLNEM